MLILRKNNNPKKMKFLNQLLPENQPEAYGQLFRSVKITVQSFRKHLMSTVIPTNLLQNKIKLLMYAPLKYLV